jgi:hypothetical protein
MIYLFWITLFYLIGLAIYGLYAYWHIEEGFYLPYKETELDRKNMKIKEGVAFCSLRL